MDERKGDWICTFTGRQFFPFDPRPEDVCAEDIAHALSLQCRFTGHVREFYSVAEHCVRVAQAVYERSEPGFDRITSCLYGLLHDASEAYLTDVARPVKRSPEMVGYREAEKRIEAVIYRHFNLPKHKDGGLAPVVKECDEILLVTEARDLMAGFDDRWRHWSMRDRALPHKILPMSSRDAEGIWLDMLQRSLHGLAEWRRRHRPAKV